MTVKKYRPYLTARQIAVIILKLDQSDSEEKAIAKSLELFKYKADNEMIAPVTETQTIEEKLGFFPDINKNQPTLEEQDAIMQSIIQSQST